MAILYPIGMAFSYFMTLISYKLLRKVSYTRSNQELAYYNQKPFEIALVMVLSEATLFILYFIQKAITKRRTLMKSISNLKLRTKNENVNRNRIMFVSIQIVII